MGAPVSFSLENKVVVITGASKGIGKAIAEACAHYGADLALGNRNLEQGQAVADACRKEGQRAEAWQLDVGDVGSIRSFVDQVLAHYGRIDVLINNAGVNTPKPAIEYSEEEYDTIMNVNMKGVFFMTTLVGKSMIERQIAGNIVTITSQAAVVAGALRSIYGAAKSGAGHLTKSLAVEWAPHKITVNAVAPTFTRTPMLEAAIKNPDFARNLEKIPMGRLAEPEEIAGAVVFLASDAARMVTGQTLCVDGGFTTI